MSSTMPKSKSLPQIRSDQNSLQKKISTTSVAPNFAQLSKMEVQADGDESSNDPQEKKHVKFSESLSPSVCRICHGGEASCPFDNGEPLISVCQCSGSMGLYHRSCLEKWLSSANRDKCEICKFQYRVERRPKPLMEFLRNPGNQSIHRNIIGDMICLIILTPMTFVSSWLCVAGAVAVAQSGNDAIAVPGLISLAVFLMATYFVWFLISLRYHIQVWKEWKESNQSIRLVAEYDHMAAHDNFLAYENLDDGNNVFAQENPLRLQPLATNRSVDTVGTPYDSPWPNLQFYRYSSPRTNMEYPFWESMV